MSLCSLYVDSDGTSAGTTVCVLSEDGAFLGELEGLHEMTFRLEPFRREARVQLTLLKVRGRFLANDILIEHLGGLKKRRRWWQRKS